MTQVPVYERQVKEAPLSPAMAPNIDVTSGQRAMAAGLAQIGSGLNDAYQVMHKREVDTEASKAEADITAAWLNWDSEARKKYRGADVDGYRPAADAWWTEMQKQYTGTLSADAQAKIGKTLGAKRNAAMAGVINFADREKEATADAAAEADVKSSITFGVAHDQPEIAKASVDRAVADLAARKHWTTEQTEAAKQKYLGDMHTAFIGKELALGNLNRAEQYYKDHNDQIPIGAHDNIIKALAAAKGQVGGYPKHSDQKLHAGLWSMLAANDVDGFMKATENMPSMMNKLSQADYEQIAEKRRTLMNTGEKQDEFLNDTQRLNDALRVNKIDPTREKDKAAIIARAVDDKMRAATAAKGGKKLTPDEKQAIIDGVFLDKVYTPSWGGLSGDETPLALVPQEDLSKAYVVVGGEKHKLSEVPGSDRAEIIRERKKRGLPITEQAILETYVRAHRGK